MGEADWERLRVTQGRPAAGAELGPDYNPLEAGLCHAVSLSKGCYIGQETLAKVRWVFGGRGLQCVVCCGAWCVVVRGVLWCVVCCGAWCVVVRVRACHAVCGRWPSAGAAATHPPTQVTNANGVKQQLWGLQLSGRAAPGAAVASEGGATQLGVLTSYANLEADGHFGLAYLKCRRAGQQVRGAWLGWAGLCVCVCVCVCVWSTGIRRCPLQRHPNRSNTCGHHHRCRWRG
jgi:folate-binding protein YgfZ